MYCPKCRSEFEEGYARCEECETDLVESLPSDEPEYTDLVTVYEGDEGLAEVIHAKLLSCGIEAWVESGETAIHLIAPNLGPTMVAVRAEDEAAARQALADVVALEEGAEPFDDQTPGEQA
jgi:hypothetical protein